MDPLTVLVVVLAVALAIGYFAGGLLNRRRAERWVRSLRDAFAATTAARVSWPSRNSFRLELDQPLPGVRHLAIRGLLAPRESSLVWALWALQGRGDLLDLQMDLDAVPGHAGLILDPGQRLGREAERIAAADGAATGAMHDGLRVVAASQAALAFMESLVPTVVGLGDVILLETKAAQPRLTIVVSARGAPDHLAPNLGGGVGRLVPQLKAQTAG